MKPAQSCAHLCLLVLLAACSQEDSTSLSSAPASSVQTAPQPKQSVPVSPQIQAARVDTTQEQADSPEAHLHMLAPTDAGIWIEFKNLDRFRAVRELVETLELTLTLPDPAEFHEILRARGADPSQVQQDQAAALVGHFTQGHAPDWSPILPVRDSISFERSVRVAPGQAELVRMGPWVALPAGGQEWNLEDPNSLDLQDMQEGDVMVRVHLARMREEGIDTTDLLQEFMGADPTWFQGPQGFAAAVAVSERMDITIWANAEDLTMEIAFDGFALTPDQTSAQAGSLVLPTEDAPRVLYARLSGDTNDPINALSVSCVPIIGETLGKTIDAPTLIALECDPTPGACQFLLRTHGIGSDQWQDQLTRAISGLAASTGTLAPTKPFDYEDINGRFTQADLVPRGGEAREATRQVLLGHFGQARARMRLASQGQDALFTLGERETLASGNTHPALDYLGQNIEQGACFVLLHEELAGSAAAPPLFANEHLRGLWTPAGAKATSLLVQRGSGGLRYLARFTH
ncbi:MAG TPA: hypothetical protein EYQ25_07420 [Planctomycetes bacterium]|nr:hypothetical protein [Planctomycetota bacterium]HIL37766.1 hypothetical protein [Planctomycetota bacterium]